MQIGEDLTLKEVQERLEKAGLKLHVNYDHGLYHAYVHSPLEVKGYERGDLVEAVMGAVRAAP